MGVTLHVASYDAGLAPPRVQILVEKLMQPNEQILSAKLLCKHRGTLTEYRMQYRRFDGSTGEMSREIYDRGSAASVLLHNPDRDTVVLVRQFRPSPLVNGTKPYLIEACAGALDGDSPDSCAVREAYEETGLRVEGLRRICAAYVNPAALTEVITMFIGFYDGAQPVSQTGGVADEGEDIEVLEMPFDEAYSKIGSGEIVDMKTIILLQALMIERLSSIVS